MGPEQPDPQIAESSGRRGPPRTVPKEILKLWDLLPRRERQRRRRRFFHCVHAACCSRPVSTDDTLASLNARVKILEEALAEFLHATAASIPVPTHPAKKRDREGAELPPAPTPANIVSETLPDIPPAAEAAKNVVSPSPITSASTSAAVPCDLHVYGLHGKDSSDVVLDVPPANIGPPVTPVSRGRTSSGDTLPGAAPHEATAHGAASPFYQHPDPPHTNIFQHLLPTSRPVHQHPPSSPSVTITDPPASGPVPNAINPLTGAPFNPFTDLPPRWMVNGVTGGWRPVRRDEWGDELSDDGW